MGWPVRESHGIPVDGCDDGNIAAAAVEIRVHVAKCIRATVEFARVSQRFLVQLTSILMHLLRTAVVMTCWLSIQCGACDANAAACTYRVMGRQSRVSSNTSACGRVI